jgi:hypothetical protein
MHNRGTSRRRFLLGLAVAAGLAALAPAAQAMEIRGSSYRVWYSPSDVKVTFEGILRLGTAEYGPIEELLEKTLLTSPKVLTLDLRTLSFLNEAGINVLYKFAIATRKKGDLQIVVRASRSIPWQGKAVPNLKKFNPSYEIVWV